MLTLDGLQEAIDLKTKVYELLKEKGSFDKEGLYHAEQFFLARSVSDHLKATESLDETKTIANFTKTVEIPNPARELYDAMKRSENEHLKAIGLEHFYL